MPKLAGRGVFFAALAVPFALAVAPLTATADGPDDVVVADHSATEGVATPDGAAVMASDATSTAVEESGELEGATYSEEGSDEQYGPGPEWAHDSEGHDQVVVEEAADTEAVESVSAHEMSVVDDDHDYTHYADDDDLVGATYEDTAAAAGYDGAWVSSTESGSMSDGHGHMSGSDTGVFYENTAAAAGHDGAWVSSTESGAMTSGHGDFSGSDTAAWHEEVTAAAGSDGAYVESVEATAFESSGWNHYNHGDYDDVTGAAYESTASGAGHDGAWAESIESAAGALD